MTDFIMDAQLEADTFSVASLDTCEIRLMNDARWPWLILVPRIADAVEWHSLFTDQRQDIDLEISNCAGVLQSLTNCEKVNIGSLGNMVRQLHIHIIARSKTDANWPGPVWGFGEREPYKEGAEEELIGKIRNELGVEDA